MDAATAIVVIAALGTLAGALYVTAVRWIDRPRRRALELPDPLERLLATEVVVNTRRPDDQAVRGVLLEVTPEWLELTRARWLPTRPGEEEAAIAGAALVPRAHVAYVQALGPAGAVLER